LRYSELVRFFFAAIAAASILTFAGTSSANGRFPQSNHVFFSPKDPDLVIVRVTFGMIISKDRGKTWDWVCEKSVGTSGVEDPMYAIGPNGVIMGTTFQGLTVSSDNACTFAYQPQLAKQVFIDLSARPDPKDVVVFSSVYDTQSDAGDLLFKSQLYETLDEGANFSPVGKAIDPLVLGETVDIAPTDPLRLYVSGVKDAGTAPTGALLVSTDHGSSWSMTIIPFAAGERSIFIAAVDPTNADRVYLRTLAAADMPARVLVSDDGGKTVRTIFTGKGTLPGFALSPDGAKIWVGGALDGVQQASTKDFAFTQKSTAPVECLAFANDGLWGCSSEKGGFIAGISTDEGATFTAKLHFCDIRGPLACASGTTPQCDALWPAQRATLGCNTVSDEGGSEPGDDEGGSHATGGCHCTFGREDAAPALAALVGVGGVVFVARRRRRRR
jgi:hypothetical protein